MSGKRGPPTGKAQNPKIKAYTTEDGKFDKAKFDIFIKSKLNQDGTLQKSQINQRKRVDPGPIHNAVSFFLRSVLDMDIRPLNKTPTKQDKEYLKEILDSLPKEQFSLLTSTKRLEKYFNSGRASSKSSAAAASAAAASAAAASAAAAASSAEGKEEEGDEEEGDYEEDDGSEEEGDDEELIQDEAQASAAAAAGAPVAGAREAVAPKGDAPVAQAASEVRSGSLRASAAMPAGGGERFEEIGLGDPRMAQLFPAVIPPGEEERKGGDEPPQPPQPPQQPPQQPAQPAQPPQQQPPQQQPGASPLGATASRMTSAAQSMPIKPSEADILTPSELGQSAKSLEEYIKKKPNMKTIKMVNDIGGFKSYLELKNKFKLKNTYKSELVSEELRINPSNYNDLELGVLYNSYLMNKFEIKELAGFRVGAVIDLKSLMGRQFTLKDLLSVGMGSASAPPAAPSAPSAREAVAPKGDAPPSGDAAAPGPVQRVELSGKETEPQITEVGEQKRILQPGYVAQRVINPDASIDSLLKNFKSKTAPQMSQMRTAEDIKGNIITYQPNVISRKKKLHFWDRN